MTDEQMDARLRAAGERWRTATAVAEVDVPAAPIDDPAPPRTQHRRRWPLVASAAVIAAALVLGGTLLLRNGADTPRPSGDVAGLQGHVWLLTGVPGTHSSATLYIDDHGNLVADDECRLISAHAAIDGSALSVTDVATRDKQCVDQYGPAFSNAGQAFLTGSSRFTVTADGLTISKNGHDLRFVLAPQQTPVPTTDFPTLTGVQWQLTYGTDSSGRAVRVVPGETLRLDPGKISASIGCAKFGATASISGDQVVIGGYFAPVACLRDPVAAMLRGTVRVAVDGAQLTVSKGRAKLDYRWVPASSAGHDPKDFLGRTWYLADGAGTGLSAGTVLRLSHSGFRAEDQHSCGFAVDRVVVQPGALLGLSRPGGVCVSFDPLEKLWGPGWQTWAIQDGRLMIFGPTQADPVVFTTTPPSAPSSHALDGTWNFVIPGASMAVSEQFTVAGGTITITHRCYVNRGTVAVSAGTLTVSRMRLLRAVPCPLRPPSIAGSERIFDARLDHLLAGAATWTLRNHVLTVAAQGIPSMTFEHASGP